MKRLKGKKVLLIGSGKDLDGRKMGTIIDNSDAYDLVCRVNKGYGLVEDTGTRTDVIFIRYSQWIPKFFSGIYLKNCKKRVVFFDGDPKMREFVEETKKETGLETVSTGLLAARWLICNGADVTIIGYGYKNGSFPKQKAYTVNGVIKETSGVNDNTTTYDWEAENNWLLQAKVTLI